MVKKKEPRYIEVQVTGRHYRPLEGRWRAEGTLTMDGKSSFFVAFKQNDEWKVELEAGAVAKRLRSKAEEIVKRTLAENRLFLSVDLGKKRKKVSLRLTPSRAVEEIRLAHGGGGTLMFSLISETLLPAFKNRVLERLDDAAELRVKGERIAFTTDSYVVRPLFFPGGDIGRLSVSGTVNDLACLGAKPLFISLSFIIEEGFPLEDLRRITESVRETAKEAGVRVVTGDTKVVEKGAADKLFVNTSGIGLIPDGVRLSSHSVRSNDAVILTGTMGDHGAAIVSRRRGLELKVGIESDVAPLNHIVQRLITKFGSDIHCIKDPTRGGVASALNEVAENSHITISIDEGKVPVKPEVLGICELLGFDPFTIANEGKLLLFVKKSVAEDVVRTLRRMKRSEKASIIGYTSRKDAPSVVLRTIIGGTRILDMPYGEQLPRIC